VSCHRAAALGRGRARIVTFVKSGCDSGFVCSLFVEEAPGVVTVQLGQKARLPAEACSPLYFSESVVKSVLVVARPNSPARPAPPCPLSGRYRVSALHPALAPPAPGAACPGPASLHLQSGCGAATLTAERSCPADEAAAGRSSLSCSHHWAGPGGLTHVVLSSPESPRLLCLSYTEAGGWLSAHSCHPAGPGSLQFNISQASPCAQTLLSSSLSSSSAPRTALPSLLALLALLLCSPWPLLS
jgi:hypothetical protein